MFTSPSQVSTHMRQKFDPVRPSSLAMLSILEADPPAIDPASNMNSCGKSFFCRPIR